MDTPDALVTPGNCGYTVAVTEIKSIEPKHFGIELKTTGKPTWIRPVNLFADAPLKSAPASRRFHNRYARVMQRYMNCNCTKLGAEHLTGGEKAVLATEVLTAVPLAAATVAFAPVNAAGLITTVTALGNASVVVSSAASAVTPTGLAQGQAYGRQMSLMSGTRAYKALPYNPAPLKWARGL